MYGEQITRLVKTCVSEDNVMDGVATELFSDKMTVYRIAFLLAFAQKFIEEYPEQRPQIYEDVFKAIYKNMKLL